MEIEVINPATEKVIGKVVADDKTSIGQKYQAARAAALMVRSQCVDARGCQIPVRRREIEVKLNGGFVRHGIAFFTSYSSAERKSPVQMNGAFLCCSNS